MNNKSVCVVTERENFDYYRAIPLWEQQVELHPLDGPTHAIRQRDPALLLIDCGFDENRGLSMLHEIKSAQPDIMVVFITEVGSEDTAVKAFRLGARDYFKKPVDLFELKVTIENLQKIRRTGVDRRIPTIPPETTIPADTTERCFPAGVDIPKNLLRVISYVDRHLAEPLTFDQLAGEAGVSRFHFCRVFKKAVGMSPMSFLAFMRIDRAKAFLGRNIPVSTVALRVGFNDLSNFNRRFKTITGITPTAYRDSLKQ
jgi:YesN/AraC family two-component response regulator